MNNEGPKCPRCGRFYGAPAATSRKDDKTPVCPSCGLSEALQAAGVNQGAAEDMARQARKAEINAIMKHAGNWARAGYKRGLCGLPTALHTEMIRGWLLGREMADLEEADGKTGADHGPQE